MTTCTSEIGLTSGANTSVPISGTVTWKDGAGVHSKPVNQPYQGRPTAITLTDVTSVQMTASSPGFNNQTLTVTCGGYTQFELTQSPPTPTIKITAARAFPAELVQPQGQPWYFDQQNHIKLTWESTVEVTAVNVEITSSAGTTGINVGGTSGSGQSGAIDNLSPPPTGQPKFGLLCTIRIRGQLSPNQWTAFSESVQVQDPDNTYSMLSFMSSSGIDPSHGIKHLLAQSPGSATQLPASFRKIMQI